MGITINLENTNNGTETGGPVTVNPTIANNIIKEVVIPAEFNVANIVDFVNTNGLIVSSFDIVVFKNEVTNSYAFFKKGAGTYGSENTITDTDIALIAANGSEIQLDGGFANVQFTIRDNIEGGSSTQTGITINGGNA